MATKTSPTLWIRYVSTVRVVDKGVNYALGEWGALVAHRPVLTLVASVIVALGLMAGLVLIADNVESASDKLWCAVYLDMYGMSVPGHWKSCSCDVCKHHSNIRGVPAPSCLFGCKKPKRNRVKQVWMLLHL